MKIIAFLIFLSVSNPLLALDIGSPAPNIYGRTIDGELFRLADKTGPLVINFFWVECVPCRIEMPELAELAKTNPRVDIISVHVEEESEAVVRAFVDQLPAHPETIVIASPMVKEAYRIRGLPHTVVINQGKIISIFEGYTKKGFEQLKQMVNGL